MKHLTAVLIACMLLMTGCSLTKTEPEEPLETVVVYQALPLPDVYMDIPESFEETSSQFYEKYYICGDASIIVTEDVEGPFTSLNAYAKSAVNQYEEIATSMEVITEELIEAKNCNVQILEFDYSLGKDGGLKMSCMTGFATDGKSMYIITCKSNAETYASHRNEFRTVMESVMLIKTGL